MKSGACWGNVNGTVGGRCGVPSGQADEGQKLKGRMATLGCGGDGGGGESRRPPLTP